MKGHQLASLPCYAHLKNRCQRFWCHLPQFIAVHTSKRHIRERQTRFCASCSDKVVYKKYIRQMNKKVDKKVDNRQVKTHKVKKSSVIEVVIISGGNGRW